MRVARRRRSKSPGWIELERPIAHLHGHGVKEPRDTGGEPRTQPGHYSIHSAVRKLLDGLALENTGKHQDAFAVSHEDLACYAHEFCRGISCGAGESENEDISILVLLRILELRRMKDSLAKVPTAFDRGHVCGMMSARCNDDLVEQLHALLPALALCIEKL